MNWGSSGRQKDGDYNKPLFHAQVVKSKARNVTILGVENIKEFNLNLLIG